MPDRPRLLTAESSVTYLLREGPPRPAVAGGSRADWSAWRERFGAALRERLGPFPDRTELRLEIGEPETVDGCVRRHVLFDPDPFSTVAAWLVEPEGLREGERRPGVLYAHGHGAGKDPAVGLGTEEYQHCLPLRLARAGYVVLAPDWRGFGERADRAEWVRRPTRDGCNVAYLAFGYFGYQLLGLQVHDGQACLDVLQQHPHVDGERLGMVGCSFGGTMTSYVSALDERVKAAIPVCYLSTLFSALTEMRANTCGAQYSPGLATAGDIPEVLGLIAPRPQMVQMGKHDTCFPYHDASLAAEHLALIYEAAGARDALEVHAFDGGHEIDVDAVLDFFARRL